MIVLSLFDGMGCGYEALKRAGIYVEKYYASEIDKYAMQIAKKNHPDIIYLGDVQNWSDWNIEKPDLIIGGSPCQGFSFAGGQLAFNDPRSKLFFEMTDIIDHFKPRFKLLENVRMKQAFLDIITDFMNCGEPHLINSALVSAQNRQRYYWYNWEAPDPVDRGLLLRDIVQSDEDFTAHVPSDKALNRLKRKTYYSPKIFPDKTGTLNAKNNSGQYSFDSGTTFIPLSEKEMAYMNREVKGGRNHWDFGHHSDTNNDKSAAVVANFSRGVPYNVLVQQYPRGKNKGFSKTMEKSPTMTSNSFEQNVKIGYDGVIYRKLTPVECERLQTLPDGYTEGVSDTQRYKMIGNGWTVEVLAHIFGHLPLNDFERMIR